MQSIEETAILALEKSRTKYICSLCCLSENKHLATCGYDNLEAHCLFEHSETSHIDCAYCSQSVSVTSLIKHIDEHYSNCNDLPYLCPACPASFNTSKSLAQHAISAHQFKHSSIFFKCGHCNQPMRSPYELASHLRNSTLLLHHCTYPNCFVKSTRFDLVSEHCIRKHGIGIEWINSTYSVCSIYINHFLVCLLVECVNTVRYPTSNFSSAVNREELLILSLLSIRNNVYRNVCSAFSRLSRISSPNKLLCLPFGYVLNLSLFGMWLVSVR